jgi:hypothetical protein
MAKTSSAAPAMWPVSISAASAASSTRPPRAQLTIRTPFFVLLQVLGREHVSRLVGQGCVQRDDIGTGQERVEIDLLDAQVLSPFG